MNKCDFCKTPCNYEHCSFTVKKDIVCPVVVSVNNKSKEELYTENARLRKFINTYAAHARTLSQYTYVLYRRPDEKDLIRDIEDLMKFREYVDSKL